MHDLIVRGGTIVTPDRVAPADVLIHEGKIVGLCQPGSPLPETMQAVDATGLYIFPGMVDAHVHMGIPRDPEGESIESGTASAAAGGITTIMLMPNSLPPVNSAERVAERRQTFEGRSLVDFAILGGAGAELTGNIVPQAQAGAVGYKSYIRPYYPERLGLICRDSGDVYACMKEVARSGLPVGFHAEDFPLIERLTGELRALGRTGFADFHPSRPEATEIIATLILLEVALYTGAHLHLVHASSPRAIELAALWRERGTRVTVEVCPHYLLFSDRDTARVGPYAQVVPPLRSPEAVERLWQLVTDGTVDIIASDHAPGTRAMKEKGLTDIFASGGGMPGLETTLPVMIDAAARGRLQLEDVPRLTAEGPARVFGLYPQKGTLLPGADADFVLVDLDAEKTLRTSEMFTRGGDAARLFDGMELRGVLRETYLRGRRIFDGDVSGDPGGIAVGRVR